MKSNCIYFVEGKCEATFLAALKERPQKILSGRVKIFNVILVDTYCSKTKVIFLPQVMNLEDELVRCTDISSISELTRSRSTKDFKRDFCAMTNCRDVLNRHQLDVLRLWTQNPPEVFGFVPSNSNLIKT